MNQSPKKRKINHTNLLIFTLLTIIIVIDYGSDKNSKQFTYCNFLKDSSCINENTIFVTQEIKFVLASPHIIKDSHKVLDTISKFLIKNSVIVSLEVGVHLGDKVDPKMSYVLSESRANEIVKYFVKNGVKKDRLIAKGYEFDNPLIPLSCDTLSKKQIFIANNRVEFKILEVINKKTINF